MTNTGGWIGWHVGAVQSGWIDSMTSQTQYELICFIRLRLENRYRPWVSSWARETQQRIESADTPSYPVLPSITWGLILALHLNYGAGYWSPLLPRWTDLQLLSWRPEACTLATLSWSRCIFLQIFISTRLIHICSRKTEWSDSMGAAEQDSAPVLSWSRFHTSLTLLQLC